MQFKVYFYMAIGLALVALIAALGADYNARVITGMLGDGVISIAPVWMTCLFSILTALLPLLWFSRLSPLSSLLSVFVYIVFVIFITVAAVYMFKLWIPPLGALLTILMAYPFWSCRRFNTEQTALDHALQNLQTELAQLGMEQQEEQLAGVDDPHFTRVSRLALAAKHLRDMHQSRADTLAFISHDIRAPLGAAIMLLENFEPNKYTARMQHLLERTRVMSDGFLQAFRAEMTDVNKFIVLDMVSLTQQVLDDVYELLSAKKIHLQIDFADEPLWVRGDFGLLFRAVSNVVQNAINYSPESARVSVRLHREGSVMRLSVIDQGPGIAEDKMQNLFKRFSRADGLYQVQDGSGLGLYFVGITANKHRGSVTVKSDLGQGAEFIISLPLERRKTNIPVINDRRVGLQPAFEDTI
jgi:signal transduction histidine kinase